MRIDSFMYTGEADMLECRLTEIGDVIDRFVIVEADVTHGGNRPKPYTFLDHRDRFDRWADQIVYVQASGLPTLHDPWSRELSQREWVWKGLEEIGAGPHDVVLHGDLDEIPTVFAAQYANPQNPVVFLQRFHPFAVDWQHPDVWQGTVAAKVRQIGRFSDMRSWRMSLPQNPADPECRAIPDAGWHFSWVSDSVAAKEEKIRSFCHEEIAPTWEGRLDVCWETGIHVDGATLREVTVDGSWPRWIVEGHAPAEWFRPDSDRERPTVSVPQLVGPRYDVH